MILPFTNIHSFFTPGRLQDCFQGRAKPFLPSTFRFVPPDNVIYFENSRGSGKCRPLSIPAGAYAPRLRLCRHVVYQSDYL
jgi:hypothetical protein